jgi:hypothetical protein
MVHQSRVGVAGGAGRGLAARAKLKGSLPNTGLTESLSFPRAIATLKRTIIAIVHMPVKSLQLQRLFRK